MITALLGACAPPPIGSYPETDEPRPSGRTAPSSDDAGARSDDAGAPGPATRTLTVTLLGSGAGTVSSTPGGVTCSGTTCKGTFDVGTAVTLLPAPMGGSVFVAWGGACTGRGACAPVLNEDVDVTLEVQSLVGTWSGSYTNKRVANGCTFENTGNLSTTLSASGAAIATAADITGLQLRFVPSCDLAGSATGAAPASDLAVSDNTVTGTWTFAVKGVGGTLAFPFTAKLAGNTMTGSWTCATCTGAFTLTKQ